MHDKENALGKGKLSRLLFDALAVTGGLVALFQFIFSDDVSSQWFRSLMNWISRALGELIAWWDTVMAPLTPFGPGKIPFSEWMLASVVYMLITAAMLMLWMGRCFVNIVAAAKLKEDYGDSLILFSLFSTPAGLFSLWIFAAATAPPWVWFSLAAALFAGIGVAVWKNIPSPKQESRSEEHSLLVE